MESFIIDGGKVSKDNFDDIADNFLNKTYLKCNSSVYRICEIEFYLLSNDHTDKYTHQHPNQQRYGRWYFHRYLNGSYKSGTYRGLDLTLGSKKNNQYCGILIRSIYDIANDKMIEGPCRTVNELLSKCGYDNVKDFMADKQVPLSAIRSKNNRHIYVRDTHDLDTEQSYTTDRVGLSDKFPEWRDSNYRYLIKPIMIKKQKKNIIQVLPTNV